MHRVLPKLSTILALVCLFAGEANAQIRGKTRVEQLQRAASFIGTNQLAEAERELRIVLKASPSEAIALNLLGTIRAKQGKLKEAETLFLRAVRSDRLLIGAHMNLSYLYLLTGEREKSATSLRDALRLDPRNVDATERLAWLLVSLGRYDDCIALIGEAKLEPPSVRLLVSLGDAHLKKGDIAQAKKIYEQVLDLQTANAEAHLGLATIFHIRGDLGTSALHLSRAKAVVKSSPELLQQFAVVTRNMGLRDETVWALRLATELRPNEPSYRFELGVAWLSHPSDLQEAEQAFVAFLKLLPTNARGQLHLGYVLLKQKRFPEAREWLEKSIKTAAGTAETFYYLGIIAMEENDNQRALGYFQNAIRLAPSFASAHVALGSVYLKLKDYPRAQQALEEGVRLRPDDTKGHYNLALLFSRTKNAERARQEMSIVESLKNAGKSDQDETEALEPPRPR